MTCWLRYGSGHVHGLTHQGYALIDFERDRLHRETRRILHGEDEQEHPEHTLTSQTRYDSLGRVLMQELRGLGPQTHIPAHLQHLISQITRREHDYDRLDQLAGITTPSQTLRWGYDRAGRLTQQTDSLTGKTQYWKVDPAGNRLPDPLPLGEDQAEWIKHLHQRWRDPGFNPWEQRDPQRDIAKWPNNRIGYSRHQVWRYDGPGNRVEQNSQHPVNDPKGHYQRQRYAYDGANQLFALQVDGTAADQPNQLVMHSFNRYVYDAFGRRLKKTVRDQNRQEQVTYFGWDGDQHVHTERMKVDGTREIEHTIYEPGSFTPMVRLSAQAQGPYRREPTAMERAAEFNPDKEQALAGLAIMRKAERDLLEASMGEFMKTGLPPATAKLLGPEIAAQMNRMLADMAQAQADERAAQSANVQIHFYHCDHLGTPLALTDRKGKIVWAIRLDPFGKELAEFNPNGMEQNIRLPGQYKDRETGLHYNRFRYYDPSIGAYITQDPIDLYGGINSYIYGMGNPIAYIDPKGLQAGWGPVVSSFCGTSGYGCIPLPPPERLPSNASLGFGGGVHALGGGISGDTGAIWDDKGNFCWYYNLCAEIGPGLAASIGFVGGLGEGALKSGATSAKGFVWDAGDGLLASGAIMRDDAGGYSINKTLLGLGAGGLAATQYCTMRIKCMGG